MKAKVQNFAGIVGHRSWIAPHLVKYLENLGLGIVMLDKADIENTDYGSFDVVYLIAGRAHPTKVELQAEEKLCETLGKHKRPPRKIVYLSSAMVDRWERGSRPLSPAGEAYVLTKKRCEQALLGEPHRKPLCFSVRAPVIFGPGQAIESDMLIPTVARARVWLEPISLLRPVDPFELVYITDLVKAFAEVGTIDESLLMPITSVRSDVMRTPLDIVSMAAPGHPISISKGWTSNKVSGRESGMRHVREVVLTFKDNDVLTTMQWYEAEHGTSRQLVARDSSHTLDIPHHHLLDIGGEG